MFTMRYVFGKKVFKDDDEYFDKPIEGFHLTDREILISKFVAYLSTETLVALSKMEKCVNQ